MYSYTMEINKNINGNEEDINEEDINKDILHYIYLLREREFIKTKENIYKIGKTNQNNLGRFSQYPNGSQLLLHIICNDCHKIEKIILNLFKRKYIHRNDIGNEYFQGNYKYMMEDIYYEVCSFAIRKNNENNKPKLNIDFSTFQYKP